MPQGNGQGPLHAGSMTGRGRGFCSGSGMPGRFNQESAQNQAAVKKSMTGCRGTQSGSFGLKARNGYRNGDCKSQQG
ncbi:MAG: DUF5320 domain-containing protein [Desulfuromonadaceae bacterium]|nr:DUF5320 domain-containing protein [Desulfuromonadaceae bacterium]